MLRRGDGQRVLLRVLDGLLARQREVAHGRDRLELGREGRRRDLEAHLVVALARAAVRDGRRAELARRAHEVLDDDRARQRRDERVPVEVQGVRAQRGHAVLRRELVARVGDVRLDGAAVQGTLPDDLEVLPALADVDRDGDDLGARGLGDPADGHRRVQAARVGEHDAFSHDGLFL